MSWFLSSVMIRLFILSFLSSRLTTKSEAVSDAVAASRWYEHSREAKSTFVIIMCRAQRPVQMWAGRFAVMSLETYAAILQAAYSYYNILSKLT
ncbi:odorant receptor 2a-like [Bacillus rossius redtenbacheri]|uniref:odorant receptor 2a-like n=1 Tax=Bacillus rossius redtenbacheri TaxID=93214 RepID=UPI002FDD5CC1